MSVYALYMLENITINNVQRNTKNNAEIFHTPVLIYAI